jgi:hypothetical protein
MQPSLMVVRGRIGWLGDVPSTPVIFRLLVKDLKDRGFSGVPFTIGRRGVGELPITGYTNGAGSAVVTFDTASPQFDVQVQLPEGVVSKPMAVADAASDVMTLRSVQEAPQPILTPVEMIAGGSGLALTALGFLTGFSALERLGEVLIVATVFTRIARAV